MVTKTSRLPPSADLLAIPELYTSLQQLIANTRAQKVYTDRAEQDAALGTRLLTAHASAIAFLDRSEVCVVSHNTAQTTMQRLLSSARQYLPAAQRAGGLVDLQRVGEL